MTEHAAPPTDAVCTHGDCHAPAVARRLHSIGPDAFGDPGDFTPTYEWVCYRHAHDTEET